MLEGGKNSTVPLLSLLDVHFEYANKGSALSNEVQLQQGGRFLTLMLSYVADVRLKGPPFTEYMV